MFILIMSTILATAYVYASTHAEAQRQEWKQKSRLDRLSS